MIILGNQNNNPKFTNWPIKTPITVEVLIGQSLNLEKR